MDLIDHFISPIGNLDRTDCVVVPFSNCTGSNEHRKIVGNFYDLLDAKVPKVFWRLYSPQRTPVKKSFIPMMDYRRVLIFNRNIMGDWYISCARSYESMTRNPERIVKVYRAEELLRAFKAEYAPLHTSW